MNYILLPLNVICSLLNRDIDDELPKKIFYQNALQYLWDVLNFYQIIMDSLGKNIWSFNIVLLKTYISLGFLPTPFFCWFSPSFTYLIIWTYEAALYGIRSLIHLCQYCLLWLGEALELHFHNIIHLKTEARGVCGEPETFHAKGCVRALNYWARESRCNSRKWFLGEKSKPSAFLVAYLLADFCLNYHFPYWGSNTQSKPGRVNNIFPHFSLDWISGISVVVIILQPFTR